MRFDLDMPAWKWPFYVARHPFEGFEDLRWKKAYNTKVSLVIVLCFFVITVCQQVMTGFLFNNNYVKIFNIVPLLVQTVILFFTWVIGNWSLCTLFDGEGSVKAITSVSAYSLVPYLITQVVVILASNVLLKSEGAFIIFFVSGAAVDLDRENRAALRVLPKECGPAGIGGGFLGRLAEQADVVLPV